MLTPLRTWCGMPWSLCCHGSKTNSAVFSRIKWVVSKLETVVLRQWESCIQKCGFINGIDNVNWQEPEKLTFRAFAHYQRRWENHIFLEPWLHLNADCWKPTVIKRMKNSVFIHFRIQRPIVCLPTSVFIVYLYSPSSLQENPIPHFKVTEHLSFMQELEARYRPTILSDLQNITKPWSASSRPSWANPPNRPR